MLFGAIYRPTSSLSTPPLTHDRDAVTFRSRVRHRSTMRRGIVLVIDGHLDLAMNGLLWNRDLKRTVEETREFESGMTQKGRAAGTVAFPEMRAGNIAVTLCTVIARVDQPGAVRNGYRTHE